MADRHESSGGDPGKEKQEPILNTEIGAGKPKRESGILRIVGAESEEEIEMLKEFKRRFDDQEKEVGEILGGLRPQEREKTEEEKRIVEFILGKMPEFVERYGGIPVNLKPEHVHFLEVDERSKERLKAAKKFGFYDAPRQFIGILPRANSLMSARTVLHEVLHFNEFQSFTKGKSGKLAQRRQGFAMQLGKTREEYFSLIGDAIVEKLAAKFEEEYFDFIPELKKMRENNSRREANEEGEVAYEEAVGVLDDIVIKQVYNKNKNRFKSEEEVFNSFARSAMTGRLLEVARLIEKSFGKGVFKILGDTSKKTF
ncbi:MAG: hypothetical protein ABSF55_02900 [Candidatus Staskawiczbacteria bacterium]|jgi:hypothetical protein